MYQHWNIIEGEISFKYLKFFMVWMILKFVTFNENITSNMHLISTKSCCGYLKETSL